MNLPGSTPTRILTGFLLFQALVFYGLSREEEPLEHTPLSNLPAHMADWQLLREGTIEQEILDVLKADDVLTRIYRSTSGPVSANLYIAFFASQRTGAVCVSNWTRSPSTVTPAPCSTCARVSPTGSFELPRRSLSNRPISAGGHTCVASPRRRTSRGDGGHPC